MQEHNVITCEVMTCEHTCIHTHMYNTHYVPIIVAVGCNTVSKECNGLTSKVLLGFVYDS